MITTLGLNSIRDNWAGVTATYPKSLQLGDGTTAPALGDTTLSGSTNTSSITIDSYDKESNGSVTAVKTLGTTQENGTTWTEVGLFDGTTGTGTDNMFARKLITGFAKTGSFVWRIEYKKTFSNKT